MVQLNPVTVFGAKKYLYHLTEIFHRNFCTNGKRSRSIPLLLGVMAYCYILLYPAHYVPIIHVKHFCLFVCLFVRLFLCCEGFFFGDLGLSKKSGKLQKFPVSKMRTLKPF